MLFHSYGFVFLFFPLCMIGFHMVKKTGKAAYLKAFLVLMSLWFYAFEGLENLPVLLFSMAVNFGILCWMQKTSGKKLPLAVGLFWQLGLLLLFKYTGSVFVPLAISFFTFSQVAFLVEGYRGNLQKTGWLDYSFYVTFFPKLIQGPIALPKELEGQVEVVSKKPFDWEVFYRNLCLFILGLSKKVLLADTFASAVSYGYDNLAALGRGEAWVVILSYTLQIYFDFSGYSDMAMGAAGMLGFSLPVNFKSPYKATNILEFWKGWHISLTRFFTNYLYIPLGGNRKGRGRTYCNMLLVFLISGIWHGAGINFIIWGMMHGVLYAITRWFCDNKQQKTAIKDDEANKEDGGSKENGFKFIGPIWKGIKHATAVLITFLYVNVSWVFFRAPSVKAAFALLEKAAFASFGSISKNLADCFNLEEFWYVIKVLGLDSWQYAWFILMAVILVVALFIVFFAPTALQLSGKIKPNLITTAVMAVLFVWCVVTLSQVSSFLYVNF